MVELSHSGFERFPNVNVWSLRVRRLTLKKESCAHAEMPLSPLHLFFALHGLHKTLRLRLESFLSSNVWSCLNPNYAKSLLRPARCTLSNS